MHMYIYIYISTDFIALETLNCIKYIRHNLSQLFQNLIVTIEIAHGHIVLGAVVRSGRPQPTNTHREFA